MGKLPVKDKSNPRGRSDGGSRGDNYLAINELHLHGNDLAELRRIAELDPDLARKIVNQRDSEDRREHVSFRFGMVSTVALAIAAIFAVSVLLIWVGVVGTLVSILGILAIALLIRVILTGEWSETSWFGKGIDGLVTLLGGKPTRKENGEQ